MEIVVLACLAVMFAGDAFGLYAAGSYVRWLTRRALHGPPDAAAVASRLSEYALIVGLCNLGLTLVLTFVARGAPGPSGIAILKIHMTLWLTPVLTALLLRPVHSLLLRREDERPPETRRVYVGVIGVLVLAIGAWLGINVVRAIAQRDRHRGQPLRAAPNRPVVVEPTGGPQPAEPPER